MIAYIIKSSLCLAIILGVYHVLFEKEKMHAFNRFYLLFGLFCAFVFPLITVYTATEIVPIADQLFTGFMAVGDVQGNEELALAEVASVDWKQILMYLYFSITAVMIVRFLYHITTLLTCAATHKRVRFQGAIFVLLKEDVLPHTFMNYIFVNEKAFSKKQIEPELFTHELTHAREAHSIDVLVIELLQIIFWFNPLLIPYKRAIQLNHEFLADAQVIKSYQKVKRYQHLLLEKVGWKNKVYLASNLNYLLTKKRLKMMTKNTSKSKATFMAWISIPIFVCLLLLFGNRVIAQITDPSTISDQNKNLNMNEKRDIYFQNTIISFNADGQQVFKKYASLTQEERNTIPPPPPSADRKNSLYPLPNGTVVEVMTKNGLRIVQVGNDTLPPPPPPPPTPPAAPAPPAAPESPIHDVKAPLPPTPPNPAIAPIAPKAPLAPSAEHSTSAPPAPVAAVPPPPPPPPPFSPSELIEYMTDKGATVMLDGKEITSEQALKLIAKSDSKYSIRQEKTDAGNYILHIQKSPIILPK